MIYNDFVMETCSAELTAGYERLKSQSPLAICSLFEKDFPIHKLAFENNWMVFIDYFIYNGSKIDFNCQDELGNTPLITASMKGHKEFINILVFLNADVSIRNKEGWSAIQESISYGNIEIVETLVRLYKIQTHRQSIELSKTVSLHKNTREFILEFSWDVKTWVPIVSKYLPSDKCKLTKSGSKLRFDSTLVDFSDQKWCRGNLSCIINPDISDKENPNQIFILNHDKKIYQVLHEFDEKDLKKEVFFLMTSDIVEPNLDLSSVSYTSKSRFWWFNQEPLIEKIGNYDAKMYSMNNIKISVKRRREHISKEQIASNKALRSKLQMGKLDVLQSIDFKSSVVEPPPISTVTWDDYKSSMMSQTTVVLGRHPTVKNSVKNLDFCVGMSEDFPLEITEIIDVLEMILPLKKIKRLRDICSTNLPPGFPVTIDIPVFPTVSANISFLSAHIGNSDSPIDNELFMIPEHYTLVQDISSKNMSI